MNILETIVVFTFGTLRTFGGDTRDMGECGRCCRAKCHTVVHSAIVGNVLCQTICDITRENILCCIVLKIKNILLREKAKGAVSNCFHDLV